MLILAHYACYYACLYAIIFDTYDKDQHMHCHVLILPTEHSAEYEVFICYYSKIVNSLSAETLSPYFVAQNIITSAEKMEIFSVPSPIKAAGLLLSKIACALDAEITEDFYKFLDITEQYGSIDSKTVTAAMRKELLEMKSTKHKGMYVHYN